MSNCTLFAQGGGGGVGANGTDLRTLMQNIHEAVQAGYLKRQILNQPLAPGMLVLLNNLLRDINELQKLSQRLNSLATQPSHPNTSNNIMQINMLINKTKAQIESTQVGYFGASNYQLLFYTIWFHVATSRRSELN